MTKSNISRRDDEIVDCVRHGCVTTHDLARLFKTTPNLMARSLVRLSDQGRLERDGFIKTSNRGCLSTRWKTTEAARMIAAELRTLTLKTGEVKA